MLRQVVFVIDADNLNKDRIKNDIEVAGSAIREGGCKTALIADRGGDFSFPGDIDRRECLIVTDEPKRAEELLGAGVYTVGLLHEYNKGAEFPRARYIFSDIADVDFDSYTKVYQRYAGEPWEILRTNRLLIRETTVEDVDEFYKIYADPEMTRYMEGLFDDPEDEKKYQRDYIEKIYSLLGFGVWSLVRLSDGKIIGRAGYSARSGFDAVEMGFLVGTEYQRQGYCMEALEAILDYGRDVLLFESVQTLVKAENLVSLHICEKLGFERTEEVEVEENIYGDSYAGGKKKEERKATYGKYVRMMKKFFD